MHRYYFTKAKITYHFRRFRGSIAPLPERKHSVSKCTSTLDHHAAHGSMTAQPKTHEHKNFVKVRGRVTLDAHPRSRTRARWAHLTPAQRSGAALHLGCPEEDHGTGSRLGPRVAGSGKRATIPENISGLSQAQYSVGRYTILSWYNTQMVLYYTQLVGILYNTR